MARPSRDRFCSARSSKLGSDICCMRRPWGLTWKTATTLSLSAKGSGRRSTSYTTEKIAVVAPIPRARARVARAVVPRLRPRKRRAKRRSWPQLVNRASPGAAPPAPRDGPGRERVAKTAVEGGLAHPPGSGRLSFLVAMVLGFRQSKTEDVGALIAKKNYARAIEVIKGQLQSGKPDERLRLQLADVLALAGKGREANAILEPLADEYA